jgi:hypothetical protein
MESWSWLEVQRSPPPQTFLWVTIDNQKPPQKEKRKKRKRKKRSENDQNEQNINKQPKINK